MGLVERSPSCPVVDARLPRLAVAFIVIAPGLLARKDTEQPGHRAPGGLLCRERVVVVAVCYRR